MQKVMVVDGNSILNRAFYGLQGSNMLATSDGIFTNAVYGFLNIMNKYIDEEKPDYLCVAFDLPAPTFRHNEFPEYKAKRKGMPEELAMQLPIIKDVLDAMNIKRIETAGFEADDIIGTVASSSEDAGFQTIIITGDRDSMQLATDNTRIKLPITKGGRTDTEEYDGAAVFEKYGITPSQVVDMKGLMGDQSDNIPGVKGIGEKTAAALIKQFGSMENLYENLENAGTKSIREKLESGRELAFISKRLATIDKKVPLGFALEDFKRQKVDEPRLYELFKKLEFKKLIDKLGLKPKDDVQMNSPADQERKQSVFKLIKTDAQTLELAMYLEKKKHFGIYCLFDKPDEFKSVLSGVAFFTQEGEIYFLSIAGSVTEGLLLGNSAAISESSFLRIFKSLFETSEITKAGYDIKPFITYLKWRGIEFNGLVFDTMLAAYILEPTASDYTIFSLAEKYLGEEIEDSSHIAGKGKKLMAYSDIDQSALHRAVMNDCSILIRLQNRFSDLLEERSQTKLYLEMELPLISVLSDMEYTGFKVDINRLQNFSDELEKKITQLTEAIYLAAGETFNLNSPKQMGTVLFEKLGLPIQKKTKTGYSTDAEVLEQLAPLHEAVQMILDYRQLSKLKTTYTDGLLNVVNPETGRIHSSFNQMVAATGRLSSTEPNLQNIPVRLEMGREIRKVFVPEDDQFCLTDADYSQIELRLLAHMSGDRNLINAFQNDEDIHKATAAAVFGVPESDVSPEMRAKAKAVNFGIMYGIGEFSLAKDLGITRYEAKKYIDGYLDKYPFVRNYMKQTVKDGKEKGYATTLYNRRRYLPELNSSNFNTRAFGERVALNMPIQGTAADIIKIAMINTYLELKTGNMKSRLILQVHDELIIETYKPEKEIVEVLLKQNMENAAKLSVPLLVEVKSGGSWYETK